MPARRLLAILAHPDDESLGLGGILARYASEGVETFVVTATLGQSGRFRGLRPDDPRHPGRVALAEIRERELRAAAAVLGVRDLSVLDYLDQQLDRVDPREIVRRLAGHIRRIRPQVVVTFGPDGAYGHPDHIAVSQFTTAALVAAAAPGGTAVGDPASGDERDAPHAVSKLYYLIWSEASGSAYAQAFGRIVPVVDGVERHPVFWPDWEVSTVMDTRAHWKTAWRAIQCHESQVTAYGRLAHLGPEQHEMLWGWSAYYRAFSLVNGGRTREQDMFDGIEEEAP
jgi:LmbE family N-acetylglucosaminyl deacetylase